MKRVIKLRRLLEELQDLDIDADSVVIDKQEVKIIEPDDEYDEEE